MSEMEDLKKAADDSRNTQRLKEVGQYLETLSTRIDQCLKDDKKGSLVYLACWLIWVSAVWIPFLKPVEPVGLLIFLIGWAYSNYYSTKLSRAFAEFRGAIKILEILGLLDKTDEGNAKKRRKYMSEFAETVKRWFTEKKAAQDKVYSPA